MYVFAIHSFLFARGRHRKLTMNVQQREPYQILVDANLLADACRFKMDLLKGFEQTLSGKVKPLITQCSMRHLYESKSEPGVPAAIELGKTFERRRCGHHPNDYPKPLSTLECFNSVVDPKSNGVNKHRYVVASNDLATRQMLRGVRGTPLVYISRSVMIMEPMADEDVQARGKEERAKLRAEIKRFAEGKKRKRDDDGSDSEGEKAGKSEEKIQAGEAGEAASLEKKKTKKKGPKGPNPLAMKKKKAGDTETSRKTNEDAPVDPATKDGPKRKRRRKNKSEVEGEDGANEAAPQNEADESD